jgi:hypothetical protein
MNFLAIFITQFLTAFNSDIKAPILSYDINLKGNVKSIELTSYEVSDSILLSENDEKKSIENYHFNEKGELITTYFLNNHPFNSSFELFDYSNYNVVFDSLKNTEVAIRIESDSLDFEIYYKTFENGRIIKDSVCIGGYDDEIYSSGHILNTFTYNENGDIENLRFISNYVFAVYDYKLFKYEYDKLGNWIVCNVYFISKFLNLDGKQIQPELVTIVKRKIEYY